MEQQDYGLANRIEQLGDVFDGGLFQIRAGSAVNFSLCVVVEDGIAHFAFVGTFAGPLRLLFPLRPIGQFLIAALADVLLLAPVGGRRAAAGPDFFHQRGGTLRRDHAIHAGDVSGPAAGGVIHHVDGVALVHEVVGPAGPTVGRLHDFIGALPHAFDDEDNRIRVADVFRDPGLDVHGAVHGFVAGLADVVAADVEAAFAADFGGGKGGNRGGGSGGSGFVGVQQEPPADQNSTERCEGGGELLVHDFSPSRPSSTRVLY